MHIEVTRSLAADPDSVFALVTALDRLPEWNDRIRVILDAPTELNPGTQWVVEMHALGQTWPSRSTVTTLDRDSRVFAYRSQTDDGNPSFADWTWRVDPGAAGSEVRVSVDMDPKTFWRRALLARIRARQLREEVPRSLNALAEAIGTVGGR